MNVSIAAVPFDRNATSLPDRYGTPTEVGDYVTWIEDNSIKVAKVAALRPTEEHEPDRLTRKTGNLSLEYSTFELHTFHVSDEPWPNVEGKIISARQISDCERMELSEGQRKELRARELSIAIENCERRLAHFRARKAEYERELLRVS